MDIYFLQILEFKMSFWAEYIILLWSTNQAIPEGRTIRKDWTKWHIIIAIFIAIIIIIIIIIIVVVSCCVIFIRSSSIFSSSC